MIEYKEFYQLMESRGYKKKVEQMNQFQLDFGENDYDDNLMNATKEFKERAIEIQKQKEFRMGKKR